MQRAGQGAGKRMRGLERKCHIVRAAEALFSEKGFKGTTTREIAARAGISEAVIFKHFRGKRALYSAIINERCSDPEGGSILINRLKGKTGKEVFLEVARFFMERYKEDPSFARLLLFSALERENFSDIFMRSKGMETINHLRGVIKGLIKKGRFRRLDPDIAARAFIGMVIHYCMWQEIFGFKKFFSRPASLTVNTFVEIFMNGMAKR